MQETVAATNRRTDGAAFFFNFCEVVFSVFIVVNVFSFFYLLMCVLFLFILFNWPCRAEAVTRRVPHNHKYQPCAKNGQSRLQPSQRMHLRGRGRSASTSALSSRRQVRRPITGNRKGRSRHQREVGTRTPHTEDGHRERPTQRSPCPPLPRVAVF